MRAAQLILPSGPVAPQKLEAGLAVLEELGIPWNAHAPPDANQTPYLAGTDVHRASALLDVARNHARLLMIRGGYGAIRTLMALPDDAFGQISGSELWGFSDGTALLGAWRKFGLKSWSAPPLIQLPRLNDASIERFCRAWQSETALPFENLETMVSGTTEGPVIAANLCVLASLVGTPWAIDLAGSIVLIEDVGEAPYRVDRLFTQLRLSGAFTDVRGFALGQFTNVGSAGDGAIHAFFSETLAHIGKPSVWGVPVGHGASNASIPIGRRARIEADVTGGRLEFAE